MKYGIYAMSAAALMAALATAQQRKLPAAIGMIKCEMYRRHCKELAA